MFFDRNHLISSGRACSLYRGNIIMRLFWFIFCTGLFIYYFADRAVKLDSFTVEAIMNNFYHYFAGFVILLGLFYLKIEHKFRWFVAFFIGVLLWDEIYDLLRGVKDTTLLTIFFNSYLIIWGSVSGLVLSKNYFGTDD
jgi:hypothetical protein